VATFTARLRVWNYEHPEAIEDFDVVVDPLVIFTRISRERLERLGVQAVRRAPFRNSSGETVEREFAALYLGVEDCSILENVVIAEDENEVLGSHTIDGFGLKVDPVQRRLVPAIMWALSGKDSHQPWLEAKR